jgi:hypothetical protein
MQIWLGKQYLGQSDKQEQSGLDGGSVREIIVTGVPEQSTHTASRHCACNRTFERTLFIQHNFALSNQARLNLKASS